jgi:hypothetical protein
MKQGDMVTPKPLITNQRTNFALVYKHPNDWGDSLLVPVDRLALVLRKLPPMGSGREWVRLLLSDGRCVWGLSNEWDVIS